MHRIGAKECVRRRAAPVTTSGSPSWRSVSTAWSLAGSCSGSGSGGGAIAERLETKRLHRVHRGVYAVGYRRLSRLGWWMAAVLAGGPGAVLSHRCAAALWGILEGWPGDGGGHRAAPASPRAPASALTRPPSPPTSARSTPASPSPRSPAPCSTSPRCSSSTSSTARSSGPRRCGSPTRPPWLPSLDAPPGPPGDREPERRRSRQGRCARPHQERAGAALPHLRRRRSACRGRRRTSGCEAGRRLDRGRLRLARSSG